MNPKENTIVIACWHCGAPVHPCQHYCLSCAREIWPTLLWQQRELSDAVGCMDAGWHDLGRARPLSRLQDREIALSSKGASLSEG
jgi:hypothetical protein